LCAAKGGVVPPCLPHSVTKIDQPQRLSVAAHVMTGSELKKKIDRVLLMYAACRLNKTIVEA